MELSPQILGGWLDAFAAEVAENEALLTDLDRQIGDADHGANMVRGTKAVAALDPADFADARFTSFGGSREFQTPAFSPKWTARYGAQYEAVMADGSSITVGGAAKYRSRMALAVDNTPVNSNVQLPGMFQEDYWLFDARVVWNDPTDRYSVGLYGQNLSDEVYKTDAQEFSSVGGIRTAYYGAPRTWMIKVSARY